MGFVREAAAIATENCLGRNLNRSGRFDRDVCDGKSRCCTSQVFAKCKIAGCGRCFYPDVGLCGIYGLGDLPVFYNFIS